MEKCQDAAAAAVAAAVGQRPSSRLFQERSATIAPPALLRCCLEDSTNAFVPKFCKGFEYYAAVQYRDVDELLRAGRLRAGELENKSYHLHHTSLADRSLFLR